jgi:hypothetical protein
MKKPVMKKTKQLHLEYQEEELSKEMTGLQLELDKFTTVTKRIKTYSILEKEILLKSLVEEMYPDADSYYARYEKRNGSWFWVFGYSNDYPLQHGKGSSMTIIDKFLELLINKLKN